MCYRDENMCKQIEIPYRLKVLLSIPLNKLPCKLQEKLCTLDSDSDYILRITSIQDDIKTDEEVIIQNKQACDGKIQGK